MENASKALIIAGAILISILIVGLGVIIYNNVSGIASGGTLDAQEISAHNSPFTGYFGDYVSGSNVRALINYVNGINRTAQANDDVIGNYIYLKAADTSIASNNAQVTASNIKTGRSYHVYISEDNKFSDEEDDNAAYWSNGYIKTIYIDFADDSTTSGGSSN